MIKAFSLSLPSSLDGSASLTSKILYGWIPEGVDDVRSSLGPEHGHEACVCVDVMTGLHRVRCRIGRRQCVGESIRMCVCGVDRWTNNVAGSTDRWWLWHGLKNIFSEFKSILNWIIRFWCRTFQDRSKKMPWTVQWRETGQEVEEEREWRVIWPRGRI
jgi:hypothetical protein